MSNQIKKILRMIRRIGIACAAVVFFLLLLGAMYQSGSMFMDSRKFPPPGEMVDIGGHSLHMITTGDGPYTIVLEAGSGGTSLDWSRVQPELSEFARVFSYDRAGMGWSEPGTEPRTSQQIATDLHALLSKSNVEPPYILVGHSFGGLNVRMFAAEYPDEVAGLVLIDSIHEDFFERMPEGTREGTAAQLKMLSMGHTFSFTGIPRIFFPPLATQGLPPETQAAVNALGFHPKTYKTIYEEATVFEDSANQVRHDTRFDQDLPLLVLSRSVSEQWPANANPEKIWSELQTDLTKISNNSKQIVVEDCGHYIHIEKPAIVVQAIKDFIEKIDH
ncbi:MAG: alpha/beta hydrolase [Candidatus Hydrogenedentota bacterium]|nr:MAG: alpha/beta hydrolase [Candidatus Hydrogenedentota bacterium]